MYYLLKDINNNIIAVSETIDYQPNGNLLIDNGSRAIIHTAVESIEESNSLPTGWSPDENGGYIKTEDQFTRLTQDDLIEMIVNLQYEVALLKGGM